MKINRLILTALIMGTIELSGCSSSDINDEKYIIWGSNVDSKEIRDYLIKRLKDANLDYRIDNENNVLIRKRDMKKATMCCS